MVKTKKISPTEWEVMEVIWHMKTPPSVRQVVDHAYPNGEKAYTTIQTIMNNLVKKGFLQTEKIGLVNFYTPLKTRQEIVGSEVKNVVARIFQGSVPALANYLIDSGDLDLEELEQIKTLLKKKEKQLKG